MHTKISSMESCDCDDVHNNTIAASRRCTALLLKSRVVLWHSKRHSMSTVEERGLTTGVSQCGF